MKFLHISDIHFDPANDGRATRDLREKFKRYVKEKSLTDINEVFFTGDFRHAFKQRNQNPEIVAKNAVGFLQDIASAVGVSESLHIHIVPGNHDLDRENDRELNSKILNKIYKQYELNEGRFLGTAYDNVTSTDYLLSRFVFFEKCIELLNNQLWQDFKKGSLHRFQNFDDYSLIYLNTAIASGRNEDRHNLLIGSDDFDKSLRQTGEKPIIILAHNPLSHLARDEQNIIKNMLKDNNAPILWLCGDVHEVQYDKNYEITCVSAGCMIQQNGTGASFFVGEITKHNGVAIQAHGYAAKHGCWQIEEAITKRINESIPEALKPLGIDEIILISMKLVERSLVLPWLGTKSSIFLEFFEDQLFFSPEITLLDNRHKKKSDFFEFLTTVDVSDKICVLGEAGSGKTTLLKQLFLRHLRLGKKALYINVIDLLKDNNHVSSFIYKILNKNLAINEEFHLFLDAFDEAYAKDFLSFNKLLNRLSTLNCYVWISCRTEFFEKAVEINLFKRIELNPWCKEMSERFILKYLESSPELDNRTQNIIVIKNISSFMNNPLRLSILLFIIVNSNKENIPIDNEYSLYSQLYENWIIRELKRGTSFSEPEHILGEHIRIGKCLYMGEEVYVESDDSAITDLLILYQTSSIMKKHVYGFFHRTLLEYVLAKNIINYFEIDEQISYDSLNILYRDDVNDFIKSYFLSISNASKRHIAYNLINKYNTFAKNVNLNNMFDERIIYAVKSQIIYYLTRLELKNDTKIKSFIKDIYDTEKEVRLKQGIAYGAATLGILDIALKFAKKLNPGTIEDLTNRSWTLVYYCDVPDEDAFTFIDDSLCNWQKSKDARIRRIASERYKDISFRMFDLRILFTFYESRNWESVNAEEYDIIQACNVNISSYPNNVVSFLVNSKKSLLTEYQKRLNSKK